MNHKLKSILAHCGGFCLYDCYFHPWDKVLKEEIKEVKCDCGKHLWDEDVSQIQPKEKREELRKKLGTTKSEECKDE